LISSLALLVAALVALVVTASFQATERRRRRAAAADRICAQEDDRLNALRPLRLASLETLRRMAAIEEQALVSFRRLAQRSERTRLQTAFLAWKKYELELDRWLLYGLPARDPRVPAELRRLSSARKETRALAQRLGAGICAQP
jgi:hypothetical protein